MAKTAAVAASRTGIGIALVIAAGIAFLQATGALSAARDVLLAVFAVLVVLCVILAPWIIRLVRSLASERSERIRSQERAEVAAHLHDSVLQTLAMVQRRSDDPREVASLARRQERELRAWLAGRPAPGQAASLGAALEAAAADVEEHHGVPVEVVAVGDVPLDPGSEAVVAAAREAMTNAAKFGGGSTVDVFAEVSPERIDVFVRDRGPGFDPAAVPSDRRGVSESIVGRMRRHGGRATISSAPGSGTEVELVLGAMTEPRVLIVDDHQLFRAGVRAELEPLLEIAGEADGVAEAAASIASLEPDVVVLDVHMPDGGGVEVIRRAAEAGGPTPVFLALSVSDDPEDVIAVIRAGARGYVTKSISGPDLADAVRRVHGGDAVFSPRLAGFVLDAFAGPAPQADSELDALTPREQRGAAAHRARLHVQGDRPAARHLAEDGRGPRVLGAAQAPALEPPRAVALGGGAAAAGPLAARAALGGERLALVHLELARGVGVGCQRAHQRARLEQHLLVLGLGVGLHDDRAAGADRGGLAVHDDRADHDVEVAAAAQPEVADRAGVDAARLVLELVDDLHRALLRGAGHRAAREAGADAVRRLHVLAELAADGRDQLVHGLVASRSPSGAARAPCPMSQTTPRSLRSRSVIIRFSARVFSSVRSVLGQPQVLGAVLAARARCP